MAYSWPIKPFDKIHPVRAFFNDPRISGKSRAFHFGIDISAPNGTAVYAVEAGTVHLEDPRAISVANDRGEHGYWHVIPVVAHRQEVAKQELLGHVQAPWLHVHFAERRDGEYLNPLRAGALWPWHDSTHPSITKLVFSRNGKQLSPIALSGAVDVIVEAHDTPPVAVPAPWDGLPVTPARLRWRVLQGTKVARAWHTPVDFTTTLHKANEFSRIYASGTRQNHVGKPGLYRFHLAHTWSTSLLPDGSYHLQVEASDLSGNVASVRQPFGIANDV